MKFLLIALCVYFMFLCCIYRVMGLMLEMVYTVLFCVFRGS